MLLTEIIGNRLDHLHLGALIVPIDRQNIILLRLVFDYELDYGAEIVDVQHRQVILPLSVVICLNYLVGIYKDFVIGFDSL
jgi:hypothetical protein